MDSTTDTGTELTKAQKLAARKLFSNAPVVALVNSYFSAPQTVEEVLAQTDSIVTYLKGIMAMHQDVQDERDGIVRDLAAVGRVLKRMGLNA